MNPFAITADIHVSDRIILGRSRLKVVTSYMYAMLKMCQLRHVSDLFIAGDLIDQKNAWPLDVCLTLFQFFDAARLSGVDIHWLRGNHETPDKKNPQKSMMTVFEKACDVVCSEKILTRGNTLFYLLPWYPEAEFIEKAEGFARISMSERRKTQILITHVGLQEGRTSMSNIQLPTRVSARHLHPDLYDLVLLGDYHMHQQVAPNAFYLGAPLTHTFGDEGCRGMWIVQESPNGIEMTTPTLPHTPPRFARWTVENEDGIHLAGYSTEDYNQIRSLPAMYERVKLRYPDADVRLLDGHLEAPDLTKSRVSRSEMSDPAQLIRRWVEVTTPAEEQASMLETGIGILKEAVG